MTAENLAAAILRDVPRVSGKAHADQELVAVTDVLAALTRALGGDDLAERAGAVLEGVTGTAWAYRPDAYDDWGIVKDGECVICQARHPDQLDSEVLREWRAKGQDPWEANARFIAWCREGVPALLARVAALTVERDEIREELLDLNKKSISKQASIQRTLTAAEAEVARLRGAGTREKVLEAHLEKAANRLEWCAGLLPAPMARDKASAYAAEARAALTTEDRHE